MTTHELWDKPKDQQFTAEELEFLKTQFPKDKFIIKYALWKQVRKNGLYIEFIIDNMPYRSRPCAADRSLDVICKRKLTDKEWEEELANFGCNTRVMKGYSYATIEQLIEEDKKYGIETPEEFVRKCKLKGYTDAKD